MGTVYRKRTTRPLPSGADIITRKGERLARWKDGRGKKSDGSVDHGPGRQPPHCDHGGDLDGEIPGRTEHHPRSRYRLPRQTGGPLRAGGSGTRRHFRRPSCAPGSG